MWIVACMQKKFVLCMLYHPLLIWNYYGSFFFQLNGSACICVILGPWLNLSVMFIENKVAILVIDISLHFFFTVLFSEKIYELNWFSAQWLPMERSFMPFFNWIFYGIFTFYDDTKINVFKTHFNFV